MTEPTTVSPLILLSVFIAGCQSNELLHVLDDYEQGLLNVLESVPIDGETFSVTVTQLTGKTIKRTVPEEIIRDTPEARQWRTQKAESSRLAIMASTGEISTTQTAVSNDPSEFDKLVASRRAFLKNTRGKAKATPAQPKKAVAPAAAAPTNTKGSSKQSGSESKTAQRNAAAAETTEN